jgi:hypothetical protein
MEFAGWFCSHKIAGSCGGKLSASKLLYAAQGLMKHMNYKSDDVQYMIASLQAKVVVNTIKALTLIKTATTTTRREFRSLMTTVTVI